MAFFQDGIKAVAAAGTAEALGTGNFEYLYLMGHTDNTSACHVGASTVVSSITGTARGVLVPDATTFADNPTAFAPLRIDGPGSLDDVYVDAVTNGDSVTYFALMQ